MVNLNKAWLAFIMQCVYQLWPSTFRTLFWMKLLKLMSHDGQGQLVCPLHLQRQSWSASIEVSGYPNFHIIMDKANRGFHWYTSCFLWKCVASMSLTQPLRFKMMTTWMGLSTWYKPPQLLHLLNSAPPTTQVPYLHNQILTHFLAHDPQPNTQATQEPFDLNITYLGE